MAIQRGKRWQVNIRFGAKFLRPTFPSKLEAEQWEVLAKDAKSKGLPPPPASSVLGKSKTLLRPFIDEVFQDLWGSNKSHKKYVQYTDEIVSHFGADFELSKMDTKAVDGFLSACRDKGNSDKTLNRKISVLSKLLKKALERDEIKKLPAMRRRKEGQGRKRFLSLQEEQALIAKLQSLGEEQAAMRCLFMIYTGARDGEVRSLKWNDIDGAKVTLEGKTGHRTLIAPTKAQEALEWCAEQGYSKPFPMAYETFKEAWDKAACALGMDSDPQWVPYVMRHTCASRLVQRGVDITRVSKWMGHSTITTTMVYAHLAPNDLEQCSEALNT